MQSSESFDITLHQVAPAMISASTARREEVQHLLANDILLHTNDIMAMVDKWKKEEARYCCVQTYIYISGFHVGYLNS